MLKIRVYLNLREAQLRAPHAGLVNFTLKNKKIFFIKIRPVFLSNLILF